MSTNTQETFEALVRQHGLRAPDWRAAAQAPADKGPGAVPARPDQPAKGARTAGRGGKAGAKTGWIGNELYFCRPHINHTDWQRLCRQQISPTAALDLHQARLVGVRDTVAGFLDNAARAGQRCVRIIHGKSLRAAAGQPTIKKDIYRWLPELDSVLAFCPRPDSDGHSGAMDVLLKRRA